MLRAKNKKNFSSREEFFFANFKGRKNCVLFKENFFDKISEKFGDENVKSLEVATKRGTVLNGVIFDAEKKSSTVVIAITGIHGNFYLPYENFCRK